MRNIKKLIEDNIINEFELINKRYEYLGLDAAQAAFIAKIFINEREVWKKINPAKAAELMGVELETSKAIIEPLIINGFVKIENNNGEVNLNFDYLIEKLLASYIEPDASSPLNHKLKWFISEIDIELNDENVKELTSLIEKNDWVLMTKVLDEFNKQNNSTFPLLITFIQAASKEKQQQNEKIKSLMEINWLK